MKESHFFTFESSFAFAKMRDLLDARASQSPEDAARSQPDFERALQEHMRALSCEVHEADFARLDVHVPGIVADGERYRFREKSIGTYMTMSGKIRVERSVYEVRGGHGGKTIAPLEMRLGMVDDHWTPAAASLAASYMASLPSQEAAVLLARTGLMEPSASHLDRLPKHINSLWEAHRVEFEEAIRKTETLPAAEKVALIMFSLDGVMVPMKDAPRVPGKKKDEPGPKGYQEASCSVICLFDADGERLHTIRFGRMPESKKVTLHRQLAEELRHLISLYPGVPVEACADGADENWRIVGETAQELGIEINRVLDFFHAWEHVAAAFVRYAGTGTAAAKDAMAYWRRRLIEEPKAVDGIIAALRYRIQKSSGKKREEIEKDLNYVVGHKEMMDYPSLRQKNWPIGSGVQEAACKTLVSQRFKQSGMSWRKHGGQGVMTLRSLSQSDRWDCAWEVIRPSLVTQFEVDPNTQRKRPDWSREPMRMAA